MVLHFWKKHSRIELVRETGMSKEEFFKHIEIKTLNDPFLLEEINQYIDEEIEKREPKLKMIDGLNWLFNNLILILLFLLLLNKKMILLRILFYL